MFVDPVVSGVTLPGDVYAGRVDPASDEAIDRAMELAGVAGTGGIAAAGASAPRRLARLDTLHNPPRQPLRDFSADYPQGATSAEGRLTSDIEGRPLMAENVAGRRTAGSADEPLTDAQVSAAAESLLGTPPKASSLPEGGAYMMWPRGDREILFNEALRPGQQSRVVMHEFGHAIDEVAGWISANHPEELQAVYHALNRKTPQQQGYSASDAPRELIAEAMRAYMADPNYMKSVAPNTAAAIRAAVNENPRLAPVIQFNTGGVPMPIAENREASPGSDIPAGFRVVQQPTAAQEDLPPGFRVVDENRQSGFREGVRAFTGAALDAVPIVGPKLREGADWLGAQKRSLFGGGLADEELEAIQGEMGRIEEERPLTSIAGSVVGATVPFLAAGATGIGGRALGVTGPTLGGRMAAGAASGATVGAADAAVRAEDDPEGAALMGAIFGGGVGAAAPPIGQAGGEIVSWLGELLSRGGRNVPTTAALEGTKQAAYGAVDNSGVTYAPAAFADMVNDVRTSLVGNNVNAARHPRASSMLQELEGLVQQNRPFTLTELDQLRQVVSRDVASSSDDAERFFGRKMLESIDNFIASADQTAVTTGDAQAGAGAITAARGANARFQKAKTIDEGLTKGKHRAESTGSGGNTDNAQRQEMRRILDDPWVSRGMSDTEREALELVVAGTPLQNTARLVGKLSPSGNGLMFGLGAGAAVADARFLAFPAVGALAKGLESRLAARNVRALESVVKGGQPMPTVYEPGMDAMVEAIMRGGQLELNR